MFSVRSVQASLLQLEQREGGAARRGSAVDRVGLALDGVHEETRRRANAERTDDLREHAEQVPCLPRTLPVELALIRFRGLFVRQSFGGSSAGSVQFQALSLATLSQSRKKFGLECVKKHVSGKFCEIVHSSLTNQLKQVSKILLVSSPDLTFETERVKTQTSVSMSPRGRACSPVLTMSSQI